MTREEQARRRPARSAGLVALVAVLLPGLCAAGAPRLTLIAQTEGEHLTDRVVATETEPPA